VAEFLGFETRRLVLGGIVVVTLVGLIALVFLPQPVPVDLGTVERGTLEVTVADEGETRVRDIYTVSAPVDGRVLRLEVEAGDDVVAHKTVLFSIEPSSPQFLDIRTRSQAEAAVKAAEAARALSQADVERAEAEMEFAAAELDRAEALAQRGNISTSALDRARLELRTKQAALETAKATLRVKEFELERTKASLIDPGTSGTPTRTNENCCVPVYSPIDGNVLRVLRESEGVVAAGTPLIEIGDPSDLEIVVDLLSTDAVQVEAGADVIIDDWGGPKPLMGRVRRVEPFGFTKISALGIEEQRVNVIIDLTDPREAWQALGHGYRVEAQIVTWRGENTLMVPLGALFRSGDRWAVFVVEGGRANLRHIEIGRANMESAEVLSGIEADTRIILHPSDRVADGVRIEERQPA